MTGIFSRRLTAPSASTRRRHGLTRAALIGSFFGRLPLASVNATVSRTYRRRDADGERRHDADEVEGPPTERRVEEPRPEQHGGRRRAERHGEEELAERPPPGGGRELLEHDDRGERELGTGEDLCQRLEHHERRDAPARGGEPGEDPVPEEPDEQERPSPDAVGQPNREEGDERPGRDRDVREPERAEADVEGVLELRGEKTAEVPVVTVEEGGGDQKEKKYAEIPLRPLLDCHWGITLVMVQSGGTTRAQTRHGPG